MRAACALNPAAGCAPSTSGRRHAAAAPASAAASVAAPTCSQEFNALSSRRCRRRRRRFPAAARASSDATGLMQLQAFDIDPLPSKRGIRPNTFPSAVLSAQEVVEALAASRSAEPTRQPPALTAFYSSELGGITTEPALAVVHFDDHLVHRGHAVFDTAEIVEGRLYALDDHLERFFASAALARLRLPFSRAQVRRTVLETAAAGRKMDGHVRYWLGAGRGGFGLGTRECARPSFFAAAYGKRPDGRSATGEGADDLLLDSSGRDPGGVSLLTALDVPPPDAMMARIKSTNYLKHAVAQSRAEEAGYDYGVFAAEDKNGNLFVTEGATVSIGVITEGGELVIPPFGETSLAGCTAKRVLELLPTWLAAVPELRNTITSFSQRPLPLGEARRAPHVFVMGSSARVAPVVRWDAEVISEGRPSMPVLRLRELLDKDRDPVEGAVGAAFPGWAGAAAQRRRMHVDVPYGFMTGMTTLANGEYS